MNERILELMAKAGIKVESWMTNPPKPFQILGSTEQFEKFAELIVGECAKIVEDSTWNLPHGYKTVDQANLVKQHFGVEE
jgi:hypothetical protein